MKKLLLWLVLTAAALAQTPNDNIVGFQTSTYAAPGTGNPMFQQTIAIYHQLSWTVSGAPASCSVQLDSSPDGITWTAGGIIATQTCTGTGSSAITAGQAQYARVNVTVISGGGIGASVTVVYKGWSVNPSGGGGGGGGTVTSVGLSLPASLFVVTGSPVTASGTLTGSFASIGGHLFLGNNTGSSTTAGLFQPACGDLSNSATSCSIDATNMGNASSGVLAIARGGTGTGSTLTGIVRGGNPFTASELSGDVLTSGSNAATVVKVNGAVVPASAAVIGTNSSSQLVAETSVANCTATVSPGSNTVQSAINALPATGGTICFNPGTYTPAASTSLAIIGNGTTSAVSTTYGVRLVGLAAPGSKMFQGFNSNVIFDCSSLTTVACVVIQGVLEGWTLENIELRGGGATTLGAQPHGLDVISGKFGTVRNAAFSAFNVAIRSDTLASFTPATNFDSLGNRYENVHIVPPAGASGVNLTIGMMLTGSNSGGNADTDFTDSNNIDCTSATNSSCYWLGAADGNMVKDLHCYGGSGECIHFQYDNGGGIPAEGNTFWQVDKGGRSIVVSGSASTDIRAMNFMYGLSYVNESGGANCPAVANLTVIGCQNTLGILPSFVTVTDGSPISWNLGNSTITNGKVTVNHSTATRALNLSNLVNGGTYVLEIVQDATGGAAMTLGTGCTWKVGGGGSGAITLTSTANAIDVLAFTYDGTNCLTNFRANFN